MISLDGPLVAATVLGKTILVVDDDEAVRTVVTRALRAIGYDVLEAVTGEEALPLIEAPTVAFDLVLCDSFLGGISGEVVSDHLARWRPPVPLILISGFSPQLDGPVDGRDGRYFLGKPFRLAALSALLKRALGDA